MPAGERHGSSQYVLVTAISDAYAIKVYGVAIMTLSAPTHCQDIKIREAEKALGPQLEALEQARAACGVSAGLAGACPPIQKLAAAGYDNCLQERRLCYEGRKLAMGKQLFSDPDAKLTKGES